MAVSPQRACVGQTNTCNPCAASHGVYQLNVVFLLPGVALLLAGAGAAVVPGSRACTPAASQPAADATAAAMLTQAAAAAVAAAVQADAGEDAAADMLLHAADAAEGQVGLEQDWPEPLPVDAAGAGQEAVHGVGTRPAPAFAGYGEEAAGLAAAEGFAAADADADDMAVDYAEQALAYDEQVSGGEEEGFDESEERFLDAEEDSSLVEAAAAFDTSGTASVSGSGIEDEGQESSPLTGQQQQQHGLAGTPPSSQDNEEDRAVVSLDRRRAAAVGAAGLWLASRAVSAVLLGAGCTHTPATATWQGGSRVHYCCGRCTVPAG